MKNANGAPRARCLVGLLRSGCRITILDQKCGQHAGNCILTAPRYATGAVKSRPCRVCAGFSSIALTISRGHYRKVRGLLGLGRPLASIVLLSSTFRRHRMGTKLGVLLASCRHLFYSSALLPTKHLHRPIDKGGQTRVIVIAGYPRSVGPVSCGVVAGQLGLCPCRQLFFSSFQCNGLRPMFSGRNNVTLSLLASASVLLVANVTSPTPVLRELKSYAGRVSLLSFNSRRSFARGSVRRVERQFGGLGNGQQLVVAARGSTAHLVGRPNLSTRLGPFVCTLPVRVRVLRGRRSGFGRRVVSCIERGAEGHDLPREGSTRRS